MLISSIVLLTASRAVAQDSLRVQIGTMMILGGDIWIPTISGELPLSQDISIVVRGRHKRIDAILRPLRSEGLTYAGVRWYLHPDKSHFPRTTAGIARGMYLEPFFCHEEGAVFTDNYQGIQHTPYVEYTYKRNGLGMMLGYQTWLSKHWAITRSLFLNVSLGGVHYPSVSYNVLSGGPDFLPVETRIKAAGKARIGIGFLIGANPESRPLHKIKA